MTIKYIEFKIKLSERTFIWPQSRISSIIRLEIALKSVKLLSFSVLQSKTEVHRPWIGLEWKEIRKALNSVEQKNV